MSNDKLIKSFENTKRNLRAISFIVLLGVLSFAVPDYQHFKGYKEVFIINHPAYIIPMAIFLSIDVIAAIAFLTWKNWGRTTLMITVGLTVAFRTILLVFIISLTAIIEQKILFLKVLLPIIFWFYIFYVLSSDKAKYLIKTKGNVLEAIPLAQK